jgi:hypothetical protein|tara:strand:- start:358 stop:519 length:162 start_codon:yes stop_codon:yes gene_type:complete
MVCDLIGAVDAGAWLEGTAWLSARKTTWLSPRQRPGQMANWFYGFGRISNIRA